MSINLEIINHSKLHNRKIHRKTFDEVENNKTHFFGVRFDNVSKKTALELISNYLTEKNRSSSMKVFFNNVHTIYLAKRNLLFAQTINNADLVLPDGSGLKIAGKIFSKPVKENLNGTDFIPLVLETAAKSGYSVYLLGSTEQIVTECINKLRSKYRSLNIAGYHSGFFSKREEEELISEIKNISPDILLIAMGSPKQEILVERIASELNSTICFAVGGLFDFISGTKKRAPLIFRKSGFEWLFRFLQDPKTKWQRMIVEIPGFLISVLTAKFFTNSIYSSLDRRPHII